MIYIAVTHACNTKNQRIMPSTEISLDLVGNLTKFTKFGSKFCCLQKILNNLNNSFLLYRKMHYPPESASIVLIIKIFALIKNNPQELTEKLNEFCSRSINEDLSLMHKMLGENHSSQISMLHEAITETFGEHEELARYLSYEGFVALLAIIGTNSQGIGTSSFADYVKKVSDLELDDEKRSQIDDLIDSIYTRFNETVGEFLNCEGSGLFLIQSKINHSCSPNAEIRFPESNAWLKVVALRDIKENEEICISYLDECQLSRSRHSRRKYLQENYLFECECEKCESQINEPDETSDEEEIDDQEDDDMDTD